jgi:hypothetical protein
LEGDHVASVFSRSSPVGVHRSGDDRDLSLECNVVTDRNADKNSNYISGRQRWRFVNKGDDVRAVLTAQAYAQVGLCGPEFVAFIHKELEEFGRIVRETNIGAQ